MKTAAERALNQDPLGYGTSEEAIKWGNLRELVQMKVRGVMQGEAEQKLALRLLRKSLNEPTGKKIGVARASAAIKAAVAVEDQAEQRLQRQLARANREMAQLRKKLEATDEFRRLRRQQKQAERRLEKYLGHRRRLAEGLIVETQLQGGADSVIVQRIEQLAFGPCDKENLVREFSRGRRNTDASAATGPRFQQQR